MGRKCDLSDFDFAMIVGARMAGLSISVTADLHVEQSLKLLRMVWKKTSSERQFCRWNCHVNESCQQRMTRLVQGDRKATVTPITTPYNCDEQKSISECTTRQTLRWMGYNSRRFHFCQPRTEGWHCIGHRLTKTEQLKTVHSLVWRISISAYRHTDDRVRILDSMDPTCFVSTIQAGGGDVQSWPNVWSHEWTKVTIANYPTLN